MTELDEFLATLRSLRLEEKQGDPSNAPLSTASPRLFVELPLVSGSIRVECWLAEDGLDTGDVAAQLGAWVDKFLSNSDNVVVKQTPASSDVAVARPVPNVGMTSAPNSWWIWVSFPAFLLGGALVTSGVRHMSWARFDPLETSEIAALGADTFFGLRAAMGVVFLLASALMLRRAFSRTPSTEPSGPTKT